MDKPQSMESDGNDRKAWGDKGKANVMLHESGFNDVSVWKSMHTTAFHGPRHIWKLILSSPRLNLTKLSPEEVEEKYQKFVKNHAFPTHDDSKQNVIFLLSAANIICATA